MTPTDVPDAELADRIDRIDRTCVQFEADWKAGRRPAIEHFMAGWAEPGRAELLVQLLGIEFHYRRRGGNPPSLAEYLGRFTGGQDREAVERANRTYGCESEATGRDGGGQTVTFASATETGQDIGTPAAVFGYQILEELSAGGQGVVYRAVQVGLNRQVALKRIRGGGAAPPEVLSRFWIEAEALGRLRHPNIVQVYDFGREGGEPYLCMELLTGGCLAERLAAGPLAVRDAVELVRALALAVQAAHEMGVIHRDLKPSNVLFDAAGVPKLVDFGLAKLHDAGGPRALTGEGEIVGTFAYMAPEQAGGRAKEAGPAADVHALGLLLYEALTGTRPYSGKTAGEILAAVIHHEPKPPSMVRSDCPRDLDFVCLRCLRKTPGDRYPSARTLADDLGRWQRGESIPPPGLAQRLAQWATRRPMLTATFAALLVLSAVHLVCHYVLEVPDSGGRFHAAAIAVAPAWAAGAALCQWLLGKPRWAGAGAYGWSTMQVALVTVLLWAGKGPASAIVAAYPLLIAGAALSFGTARMTWYTAGLTAAGYSAVVLGAWRFRPSESVPPSVSLVFVAMLLLMALIQSLLLRGSSGQQPPSEFRK